VIPGKRRIRLITVFFKQAVILTVQDVWRLVTASQGSAVWMLPQKTQQPARLFQRTVNGRLAMLYVYNDLQALFTLYASNPQMPIHQSKIPFTFTSALPGLVTVYPPKIVFNRDNSIRKG
jgi:hypothetical protein